MRNRNARHGNHTVGEFEEYVNGVHRANLGCNSVRARESLSRETGGDVAAAHPRPVPMPVWRTVLEAWVSTVAAKPET